MTTKHTPGPWHYFNSGAGLIRDSRHIAVAQLKSISSKGCRRAADLDEEVANARLIAAAPELRESLSLLVRTCQDAARHGWSDTEKDAIHWAAVEAQVALKKVTP